MGHFSILSCIVLMLLPEGILQTIALFALAAWLVTYGFVLARRLILAYNRAIRIFNETYSDDIGAYIKWLSIFTWWAVIFGVGCGLLTFLPDKYVYIWILSSIPFYGYLFYSYQNYMIFYEQVERTLEIENAADDEKKKTETEKESPKYFDGIESSLMLGWKQELYAIRIHHTGHGENARHQQDLSECLHKGQISCDILRMDNRPSVGIREDHAEGVSGNEHTKNRGVVRLFVPQLFYQVVH